MKPPTSCPDCERASRGLWHAFVAGCQGCEARSIARSPQFFRVRRRGKLDFAYRALLAATFKFEAKDDVKISDAHEDVKAAFRKDAMFASWRAGDPA